MDVVNQPQSVELIMIVRLELAAKVSAVSSPEIVDLTWVFSDEIIIE